MNNRFELTEIVRAFTKEMREITDELKMKDGKNALFLARACERERCLQLVSDLLLRSPESHDCGHAYNRAVRECFFAIKGMKDEVSPEQSK